MSDKNKVGYIGFSPEYCIIGQPFDGWNTDSNIPNWPNTTNPLDPFHDDVYDKYWKKLKEFETKESVKNIENRFRTRIITGNLKVIEVKAAGFNNDEISVVLENNIVKVVLEKSHKQDGETFFKTEKYDFQLKSGEVLDDVYLQNGLLSLRINTPKEVQPKKIKVREIKN
jgi:HSP20 family molecular chaperone IbpA